MSEPAISKKIRQELAEKYPEMRTEFWYEWLYIYLENDDYNILSISFSRNSVDKIEFSFTVQDSNPLTITPTQIPILIDILDTIQHA